MPVALCNMLMLTCSASGMNPLFGCFLHPTQPPVSETQTPVSFRLRGFIIVGIQIFMRVQVSEVIRPSPLTLCTMMDIPPDSP